jgi:acyl-homoserine-lactone acylase
MLKDMLMYRYRILILFFIFFSFALEAQVNTNNITIVRDKYGVPHIYGITDKEAAYGLAWAHAEDDFSTIQKTFLPAKGLLGRYQGINGAVLDYAVELLRCREVAKREMKNLPQEGLQVIEGYLEGLNAYAKKYPKKILVKNSFPLSTHDYLTGLNLMLHLFSDTGDVLGQLLGNNIEPIQDLNGVDNISGGIGSNAFAFNSNKTLDGKTYLNVNTHQPLEGPFSWYEAHVNSEDGWNMLGGLFPGLPIPVIGTNEYLGWTHTYNYPDINDIYQLIVNPDNENQYMLDGEWKAFEKKEIKILVKILFGIKVNVKRDIIWSVYGPVIKNKKGYFSFYTPSLNNISAVEQWYKMTKATNFQEFESALKLLGIPRFNIVYADRKDNIFYMSNARLSVRDKSQDWTKLLLGDTSSLVLNAYHPYSDLPKFYNPKSGYIFNTNNSPFNATSKSENLIEDDFPITFKFREKENNRSLRFMELIDNYDKITYEDFKTIKYDQKYPKEIFYRNDLNSLFNLQANKYPKYKELISILLNWNKSGGYNNLGAAQWRIYFKFIREEIFENKLEINEIIPESYHIQAIEKTKKYLIKHFGKVDIILGDLQRHIKGDVNLPVSGLVDMIAPADAVDYKNGTLRTVGGESYIMLLRYSEEDVEIETIIPYGNSKNPESPHYTDQMLMFINKKTKTMTLDKEKIFRDAVRIYSPN